MSFAACRCKLLRFLKDFNEKYKSFYNFELSRSPGLVSYQRHTAQTSSLKATKATPVLQKKII